MLLGKVAQHWRQRVQITQAAGGASPAEDDPLAGRRPPHALIFGEVHRHRDHRDVGVVLPCPGGDGLGSGADPARARRHCGDFVKPPQALKWRARGELRPQIRGIVGVVNEVRIALEEQAFKEWWSEREQVALNHHHVEAIRAQHVPKPAREEEAVEGRLVAQAAATGLDQTLVDAFGHRSADARLDPAPPQVRQILQHPMAAARIRVTIEQKKQSLHRALTSSYTRQVSSAVRRQLKWAARSRPRRRRVP